MFVYLLMSVWQHGIFRPDKIEYNLTHQSSTLKKGRKAGSSSWLFRNFILTNKALVIHSFENNTLYTNESYWTMESSLKTVLGLSKFRPSNFHVRISSRISFSTRTDIFREPRTSEMKKKIIAKWNGLASLTIMVAALHVFTFVFLPVIEEKFPVHKVSWGFVFIRLMVHPRVDS